jgi:hypothetical protein
VKIELTSAQAIEAVKLVRVLASFPCENDNDDDTCDRLDLATHQMCGPCHAADFLMSLEDEP